MRGIHPKVTSGICRGGARYLAHNARFVAHLVSHPIDTTYHDVLVPMSRVASALGRAVVLSIQDPECAAASSQELVRRLCAAADDDPEEAIACMTELLLPFGVARLAAIAKNKVKASAGAGVGARFFALLQKARPVVAAIKECDAVAKVVAKGKGVAGQVKEVLAPLQSSVKGAAQKVARSGARSIEQILPRVKTYEQARNQALKIVGDMGAESIPWIGSMEKSAGFERVIGRLSSDKKKGWRLDWDSQKGIHINVSDFTAGKRNKAKKYCIPFHGNEDTFKSLLRHLNR